MFPRKDYKSLQEKLDNLKIYNAKMKDIGDAGLNLHNNKRLLVYKALIKTCDNRRQAAMAVGISQRQLYRLINNDGIE